MIEKLAAQLFKSSVAYGLIHKTRYKTEKFLSYGVAIDFTRHIRRLLNPLKLNNLLMKRAELVKMLSSFYNKNEKSEKSQSNQ